MNEYPTPSEMIRIHIICSTQAAPSLRESGVFTTVEGLIEVKVFGLVLDFYKVQ